MKFKKIALVIKIILAIGLVAYFYRGKKLGKIEWEENKRKSFCSKIVKTYKPEGVKIKWILFSNGEIFKPDFFDFNFLVQAGDSLCKNPNSYNFTIYKENPNDTITFVGHNSDFE